MPRILAPALREPWMPWTTALTGEVRPQEPILIGSRSSVTVPTELRVTGSETKHMPFYLRTFFRVLSSWVHRPIR
jgi:hypothetical protein